LIPEPTGICTHKEKLAMITILLSTLLLVAFGVDEINFGRQG
jgi:hypothetical protein